MFNLLGEFLPQSPEDIIRWIEKKFGIEKPERMLVSLSGGNDSRTLAHIAKPIAESMGVGLELAAIDTGLSMNIWRSSIEDYARWIGLPVRFWKGEGRKYYREFVEQYGFPGNALHSQIQQRLKGRAYRAMRREYGAPLVIMSGIRKMESRRRMLLTSPYSSAEGVCFASPLFYWENYEVHDYMHDHAIPVAPGKQYDCKCGATAADGKAEWAEIAAAGGDLYEFLSELQVGCSWKWGQRPRNITEGESFFDLQQGMTSVEDYPVCAGCWRDAAADEQQLMEVW